ncbi:MAG: hypothetical protein ACREQW_19720 [Candidatus Binatia bacterium]
MKKNTWVPPEFVAREKIIKDSEEVLAMPDIPVRKTEDVIRIRTLGMDWDIGFTVYEPQGPTRIPVGPDGKKAGFFILHGGSGDFKQMERVSLVLAQKFGHRVLSGTFLGRLYLLRRGCTCVLAAREGSSGWYRPISGPIVA